MEISRLPRWQSVKVMKVDPLAGNQQIVYVIIRGLREVITRIGKLFCYRKWFESSRNWI